MCANQTSMEYGRLCGMYPSHLGHLYSPGSQRGPWHWMPYALDNGAFPAFTTGKPWAEPAWMDLLRWSAESCQRPRWALVPDVVADPVKTLEQWHRYAPIVRTILPAVPLAFAAQDGHGIADVPADADVVFVGGSNAWKPQAIRLFSNHGFRVHVGRINTFKWLRYCADAGVESCDGTGWFRGDKAQLRGLEMFMEQQMGTRPIEHQQCIEGVA